MSRDGSRVRPGPCWPSQADTASTSTFFERYHPPERVDDDLIAVALEALDGEGLDVHLVWGRVRAECGCTAVRAVSPCLSILWSRAPHSPPCSAAVHCPDYLSIGPSLVLDVFQSAAVTARRVNILFDRRGHLGCCILQAPLCSAQHAGNYILISRLTAHRNLQHPLQEMTGFDVPLSKPHALRVWDHRGTRARAERAKQTYDSRRWSRRPPWQVRPTAPVQAFGRLRLDADM